MKRKIPNPLALMLDEGDVNDFLPDVSPKPTPTANPILDQNRHHRDVPFKSIELS